MSQPDPNNELRHLIRSAKEEVAALDARFDRLESVARDQRTDADHIRVTLNGHTALLGEHSERLAGIERTQGEHSERLAGIERTQGEHGRTLDRIADMVERLVERNDNPDVP